MKYFLKLVILALLSGLLIACSTPPESPEAVVEEVAPPTIAAEVEEAEPEVEPEAEMAEEEVVEEMEEPEPEAAEEVMEESPVTATDGPTHEAAITVEDALVERPYDQAKGADDPLLTIIEYGDFQ